MDQPMPNEPNYKEIGIRLREVRGALSQKTFGDSIGYSYSYVKDCEHGKKQSLEFLFKVSSVYNVTLEWILRGTAPIEAEKQKVEAIFDPDLKIMIDVLKGMMESGDPDLRGWAKIQFKTAFREHCAAAVAEEKKLHA